MSTILIGGLCMCIGWAICISLLSFWFFGLGGGNYSTILIPYAFSQKIFQEKVMSRRQSEFERLRQEREEHIQQIRQARRQEREAKRKMIFYLRSEEERLNRLREEEESRKREGMKIPSANKMLLAPISSHLSSLILLAYLT